MYPGGYNQTAKKHRAHLSHCLHWDAPGQILTSVIDAGNTVRYWIGSTGMLLMTEFL
ncbi:hypothetical protein EYZ11_000041 [Aspergillus tanneri]|uniref:Uncharacterized protein n=1 Tax=Aspergillus tanneri TaxID=1220188 RepID=A0A4S3JY40_9EURO|nr:hypothetical protein EYZ11_000041 [Aspergillus tanneri]